MHRHPYESLPAERFWRKAVAGVPPFALDPLAPSGFRLSRSERIATAGSCFAQRLSRALQGGGFNFLLAEPNDEGLSARYGNVYTTRQLAQLFDRAFGRYRPTIGAWRRDDGRHVDPFRPRTFPEGFADPSEVEAEQERHLARVREMFVTLDTFVFTLGLTEGWRHAEDGAALPVPPGVTGGEFDEARYGFANASVAEMTGDLVGFVGGLRAVNPHSRVVLTVSPVAITATYEARHVLVSNSFSKSALRVVADEVARARPDVHYFPSYEIITAPANVGRYLTDDLRTVNEAGVAHVMRCFFRHADGATAADAAPEALDIARESARVSTVICEEELLDA